MTTNLISLVIILSISSLTYLYLRQAIKPIVSPNEFKIWITSWVGITTISFISINALMLFFLCGVFILWAYKKVDNKIALYFVVSYLVQGYVLQTPLLNISYQTVLGLTILLPLFLRIMVEKKSHNAAKSRADMFLILYLLLIYILTFRGLETKNAAGYLLTYPQMIKIGATYFLQYFLPYFVISRYIKSFDQIKTITFAIITFCLLLSTLAIYEIATTSGLYAPIPTILGVDYESPNVMRAGLLRATVSIDHPLNLGVLLMIGLSLFTFVSKFIKNKLFIIIGFALLALGFIAPLSKGPWAGALISFIIIYLFSPNKLKNGFISLTVISIILILLLNSPYAEKVISLLPFIGTEDTSTTDYRALLFKQAIIIIDEFPLFGMYEPTLHDAMLPLYQGEGIVDLVNVYVSIALLSGLVGLFLYVSFILAVALPLIKELILFKDKRSNIFKCGASLIGSLIAILIVLASISDTIATNTILLSICGLIVGYTNVVKDERKSSQKDLTSYSTTRVAIL